MSRALLFVACAASLLAPGALAQRQDEGASSCGREQRWSVGAGGQSKECCTDPTLGSVTQFKYTVDSFAGTFDDNIHFEVKAKTGAWQPQNAACSITNNGATCTGGGCKTPGLLSSSSRRCEEDVNIKNEPQRDICVVATCNNPSGVCSDAKVAISFWHLTDDNSMANMLNMTAASELCPDVCTAATRPYIGKCGTILKDAPGRWCPAQANLDTSVCCAADKSKCCDLDAGALSGIIIAVFVAIVVASMACCWCGKCCCFSYRKGKGVPATTVLMPGQQVQMTPSAGTFGQPSPQQQAPGYPGYPSYPGYPQAPMTQPPQYGQATMGQPPPQYPPGNPMQQPVPRY